MNEEDLTSRRGWQEHESCNLMSHDAVVSIQVAQAQQQMGIVQAKVHAGNACSPTTRTCRLLCSAVSRQREIFPAPRGGFGTRHMAFVSLQTLPYLLSRSLTH